MKNKFISKRSFLILLLPFAIIFSHFSSLNPSTVERVYSTKIYKFISQILSLITGIIPISVAELILLSLFAFMVYKLVTLILAMINDKKKRYKILANNLVNLVLAISTIYFIFIFSWGLNYHRSTFAEIAGYDEVTYTSVELAQLAEHLIDQANDLRQHVEENKDGVMTLPNGSFDVMRRADKGFDNAAEVYPALGGKYGKPKVVLMSRVMSYTGVWGVYFPFTAEANVNISIPDSLIPSTALHEMAHQRGFAREDEADYIAYLTATMHPDVDFQYSGTLMALRHTMRALARADVDVFRELYSTFGDGLQRDWDHINAHNQQHESIVRRASSQINNTYLKANAQKDGVQSYGRMIDLLMANYLQN